MKSLGIVNKVEGNKITVQLYKDENCKSCSACSHGSKFAGEYNFISNKELKIGQEISFKISDSTILKISFLIYVFPFIIFFISYLISQTFIKSELINALIAITAFLITFLFIHLYDKKHGSQIINDIEIIETSKKLGDDVL